MNLGGGDVEGGWLLDISPLLMLPEGVCSFSVSLSFMTSGISK